MSIGENVKGFSLPEAINHINWDNLDEHSSKDVLKKLKNTDDSGRLNIVNQLKIQEDSELFSKYPTLSTFFYEVLDNGKTVPDYYCLAEYFKDELNFVCDDSYQHIYKDTHYVDVSKSLLRQRVINLTQKQARPFQIDQFLKIITSVCAIPKSEFKQKYGLLNLKNGVLDVHKGVMMSHSPKYNFRYCLSHKYDPEAKCPVFLKFLRDIFEGDEQLVLLMGEIIGYTIVGGPPLSHKAFMFYGDGRNGKSTLLETITNLIGKENVSSVNMGDLGSAFSCVRFDGKLANIVEESPEKINPEAFKNIVGGGYVTAAYKGKDEFELKVNARIFFSCNDYPNFKDASRGNRERLVIVPFNRFLEPHERDGTIRDKIDNELPGVLNFALEGFKRFKKQGNKFTKVEAVEKAHHDFVIETDSFEAWFEEAVQLTENENDVASVKILYQDYRKYCEDNGMMPLGIKKFGRRFTRKVKRKSELCGDKNNRFRAYRFVHCTGNMYLTNRNNENGYRLEQ